MASSSAFTARIQSYYELSNLSNRFVPFNVFKLSLSFQTQIKHTHRHGLKLKHLLKAAPEGSPSELMEDSKFVPLNPDDPTFGPPALLLTGFQVDEIVKIQNFLKELDGEFLEVIFCTEDMMMGSLWEAINTKQPNLEASKIAKSLPRICFLSGLTGEEMMMFIDAFPESGLAGAVFAAVVPNSADKPLQEVVEEIMGDHEMMIRKWAKKIRAIFDEDEKDIYVFYTYAVLRPSTLVHLFGNQENQARDIKLNWRLIVWVGNML